MSKLGTVIISFLAIYPDGKHQYIKKTLSESGYERERILLSRACKDHKTCVQMTDWRVLYRDSKPCDSRCVSETRGEAWYGTPP